MHPAVDHQPANGYLWYEMGLCQVDLGLRAAATASFEQCISLRPDYREAREELQRLAIARANVRAVRCNKSRLSLTRLSLDHASVSFTDCSSLPARHLFTMR
jgi:Tfp pilus assembly protein PilF